MVVSGLTLSLFEDMGWYLANFSAAETLRWGLGMGCPFVNQKCSPATWPYFCNESTFPAAFGCDYEALTKSSCNLGTYADPLPTQFQYFTDSTLGGQDDLMDYCPYQVEYSDSSCMDPSWAREPTVFESSSTTAACMKLYTDWGFSTPDFYEVSECYDVTCTSPTDLTIRYDGTNYRCVSPQTRVNVSTTDYLTCPYAKCATSTTVITPFVNAPAIIAPAISNPVGSVPQTSGNPVEPVPDSGDDAQGSAVLSAVLIGAPLIALLIN
jgi:hypothetical protein